MTFGSNNFIYKNKKKQEKQFKEAIT